MNSSRKSVSLIIRVTDICNLNCAYCYSSANTSKDIISISLVEKIFQSIANFNDSKTHIIWHGGEPLLAGLQFYEKVVDIQKSFEGHEFTNSIQTNGTLLNDNFIDLFKENNFKIGISLDGIERTHDLNRLYKNSQSTFSVVFENLIKSQKKGILNGIICVLNKNTVNEINEIYRFMKENEVSFHVNPQIDLGNGYINNYLSLDVESLNKIMIQLFDLWYFDTKHPLITIEPFKSMISQFVFVESDNQYSTTCFFTSNCLKYFMSINPRGDVFPCGRFGDNFEFLLGNINENSIESMQNNSVSQLFNDRLSYLDKCCKCKYFQFCLGGCPNNSLISYGNINKEDNFCRLHFGLFEHIEHLINNDLKI